MGKERGETGEYVETVTLKDVLGVFDRVRGPVVLSVDVADELDCSKETARRKLKQLYERGDVDRRKAARRVFYWRTDNDSTQSGHSTTVERSEPEPDRLPESNKEPRENVSPATETDAIIDDVLDEWPPAGQQKREQRRRAGLATLEYIRDVGAATASDVKRDIEPDAPVDGQSPDTWWRKSARPALERARDADVVTFTDGSKVWEWVGNRDDVQGDSEQDTDTPTSSGVYDPTKEF